MNITEYPLLKIYFEEIQALNIAKRYLSLIILCGMFSEIFIRELTNNEQTLNFGRLLKQALNQGLISVSQFELINELRIYRNKYVHFSANKVMTESFDGLSVVYEDGTFDFINEIVNYNPNEENLEKVARLHLIEDAKHVHQLFQGLIDSLN